MFSTQSRCRLEHRAFDLVRITTSKGSALMAFRAKDPFLYSLYTNLYSSLQLRDLRFVKLRPLDYQVPLRGL